MQPTLPTKAEAEESLWAGFKAVMQQRFAERRGDTNSDAITRLMKEGSLEMPKQLQASWHQLEAKAKEDDSLIEDLIISCKHDRSVRDAIKGMMGAC